MSSTATKPITADDLLKMGDIGRCDLIYGELIVMSLTGAEHGVVAMRLGAFLNAFVTQHGIGVVFAAETGFKIASSPDLVRAPDASYVRKDRLAGGLTKGYFDGVPDLAVEVLSPDDRMREVAEKIAMWLAHGTQVVWEADPRTMTVIIHRVGQPPQRLGIDDTLREVSLLAGFELPLSKVFTLL